MQGIDRNTVMFVRAVFRRNSMRLKDEPPSLNEMAHLPDDLRQQLEETAIRRAANYDFYRDLVILSTALGTAYTHYVVPANPEAWGEELRQPYSIPVPGPHGGHLSTLIAYYGEAELLSQFWSTTTGRFGPVSFLAGWQFRELVLPILVSKAYMYNVPVPDQYKLDITRRFGQSDNVISVDGIYTQGVHSPLRPMPDPSDVMEWWGVPQGTGLPYPSDHALLQLTTSKEWGSVGCQAMEKSLWGMQYLVGKYYGYTDGAGYLRDLRCPTGAVTV